MNSAMGAIVDARLWGAYLGYLESRLNSGFPPPFVAGLILLWVNGGLLCLFSPLSLGWLRFGLSWASAGIGRPSVKITSKHETRLGSGGRSGRRMPYRMAGYDQARWTRV